MKTTIYIIALLLTSLLMSCSSSYNLNDGVSGNKEKDEDSDGFHMSGTTTNPVAVMDAANRYKRTQGEVDRMNTLASADSLAIVLDAKSEANLRDALAEGIREAAKTFPENPENVQAVGEWIMNYAYVKFSESTGNRYSRHQMMPHMQYEYNKMNLENDWRNIERWVRNNRGRR